MSGSCGVCSRKLTGDTICCYECSKTYHLECVNITMVEFKYLTDNNESWKCPACVRSGRRLRSASVNSVKMIQSSQDAASGAPSQSASSSQSSDQFDIVLRELRAIRSLQENIVSDLAAVKLSQTRLSEDLNARVMSLKNSVDGCNATLAEHVVSIRCHEERLVAITDKVSKIEDELTSTAASASDPSRSSIAGDVTFDQVAAEFEERQRRRLNVMVFGLPESSSSEVAARREHDADRLSTLFDRIQVGLELSDCKIVRIGSRREGGNRPIRISLPSRDGVVMLLKNASKIRNFQDLKNVSISFDKTPRQQVQYRQLKQQLVRRQRDGERGLRIRTIDGTPRIVSDSGLN